MWAKKIRDRFVELRNAKQDDARNGEYGKPRMQK